MHENTSETLTPKHFARDTQTPWVEVAHPLKEHYLSIIRNQQTTQQDFRHAVEQLSYLVLIEATQTLPTVSQAVETPLCRAEGFALNPQCPILWVPILRAGLMISQVAERLIPDATVVHLGLYRDEETLEPVAYYNKLAAQLKNITSRLAQHYPVDPANPLAVVAHARAFVLDPMLATGGSAIAALTVLQEAGLALENIQLVSILAAPEGLQAVQENFPTVQIITAKVDQHLNSQGYIVPGLGDAGDRCFGT